MAKAHPPIYPKILGRYPASVAIILFFILKPYKLEKAFNALIKGDIDPLLDVVPQVIRSDGRKWRLLCEKLALADLPLGKISSQSETISWYLNKIGTQSILELRTLEETCEGLIACQLYLRFLERDSRKKDNSRAKGYAWSTMARIYCYHVPSKKISPQGADIRKEALFCYNEAISCYDKACTIYRQKALSDQEANTLYDIAGVYVDGYRLLGDRSYLQQAKKHCEGALTLYDEIYQGQNDPKNIRQSIERRLHSINNKLCASGKAGGIVESS
jgi:hypothetical protein